MICRLHSLNSIVKINAASTLMFCAIIFIIYCKRCARVLEEAHVQTTCAIVIIGCISIDIFGSLAKVLSFALYLCTVSHLNFASDH